jgi:hypothetical protein
MSDSEVEKLLNVADRSQINSLDTASSYGDAEARIGTFLNNPLKNKIITKFSLSPKNSLDLESHLHRLNRSQIYGLLFHNSSDLLGLHGQKALKLLSDAREAGVINKIGVSVYTEEELHQCVEKFSDLSIVQIPGNVVDNRLVDSQIISDLKQSGVEVHVRSAFLQGILLASRSDLPNRLSDMSQILDVVIAKSKELEITQMELCLGFLKNHPNVDGVVVGTSSSVELIEIADSWSKSKVIVDNFYEQRFDDFLDPREWPKE